MLLLMTAVPYTGVCGEPEIRIKPPGVSDAGQKAFRNELSLVARRSVELGRKRFSKIKNINDSYQLTAKAIRALSERGDVVSAIPLLREASEKYDGNRMAYLLLGAVFERMGERNAAAHAYADFYRISLTLVPFEKELIGPSSLRIFCGYVEKRFSEWGLTLPTPRVGFELQRVRSVIMLERSRVGQWINLILPVLVLVGLVLILLARLGPIALPAAVVYFSVSFYLLLVLGYLLWAAHFFMGLPFLISLETEYALFFGGGTVLIGLLYAANRFLDPRREPKTEDSKICPHCHALILRVALECPICKRACRDG